MKSHLLRSVLLLSLITLTSGCQKSASEVLSDLRGRADDSCRISYKSGESIKVSGIEIPLTRLPEGSKLKIGNVEYRAAEAYQLSQAAQALEQARLSTCVVVNARGFPSMSDQYKSEIFSKVIALADKMVEFGNQLKVVTSVEAGLAAADAGAAVAKDKKVDAINAEARFLIELSNRLTYSSDAATMRADRIEKDISAIRDDLGIWKAASRTEKIEIVGFDKNGTSLPAAARQELVQKIALAIRALPEQQRTLIIVVGYADKPGAHLRNVELGLRRAQTVVNYLNAKKFPRQFESRAVSGGIDEGAYGRRVSVYISHFV